MSTEATTSDGPTKPEKLRIAITGSSGLVGANLSRYLAARGHEIIRVVRRPADPEKREVHWRPGEGEIDAAGLEGTDAVVHLAGENIFGRWTAAKKERILQSRRQGTELLACTLATLRRRPRVLVSASAVGYYGDTGDRTVNESAESGGGFLAEVCRAWENAARPAAEAGIRVVHLRLGVVLSAEGGALSIMRTVFRLGIGGRLGSGKQFMSWIHLDDLVRTVETAILDESLQGPLNVVAPQPVTNRELTRQLGRVLRRPTIFPVPRLAAKMALGEMGEEVLLAGQRVEPAKLRQRQFEFHYPELSQALQRELG